MKITDEPLVVIKPAVLIGGIIPSNKLTLITGLPGTGKSYTTVKFLNSHMVKPIVINLDNSPFEELTADTYDHLVFHKLIDFKYDDLEGKVVIIDTYSNISLDMADDEITHLFLRMVEEYGITLIVIAHTENYASNDAVFTDNVPLVRNAYEHIHMSKQTSSDRATKDKTIHYHSFINKGRSSGGAKVIQNWMR